MGNIMEVTKLILDAILVAGGVFMLASIINHFEEGSRLEKIEKADRDRLRHLASLYGREE